MKSSIKVLKEQLNNIQLVRRLSLYEIKSQTSANYLGAAWDIINPGIQIMIYWFVFGFGIRQRAPVGDVEYLQWMFAGILVWFFINQGIMKSTRSIYSKIRMLSKMNFPMSIIPNYVVISLLYPHLILLGIGIIILNLMGYPISIYYLQLPIYIALTVALLFSIALITSTLATIVRDVQMMLQATMRMLLYLSPILWPPTLLPESWQTWLKLNPFYFIIEGYRNSLLGQSWYFLENPMYTLYFITVIIVLFMIGSYLHVKFRSQFIDFL